MCVVSWDRGSGWPVSPRNSFTCLESQVCTTWVLGIKLGSPSLHCKHFTNPTLPLNYQLDQQGTQKNPARALRNANKYNPHCLITELSICFSPFLLNQYFSGALISFNFFNWQNCVYYDVQHTVFIYLHRVKC